MATATLKTQKIDPEVLLQIANGSWNNGQFTMPQMDPKLYQKVKKVLLALGGKWNRSAQATLFEDPDAETSVRMAVKTGEYVDLKKAYQQFDTPEHLAERMVTELDLGHNRRVLEPSAGTGNLVRAVTANSHGGADLAELVAVEIDPQRVKQLQNRFINDEIDRLIQGDFLEQTAETLGGTFDRIIMNPPFTNSQDIKHVRHAHNLLDDNGILVAIMSPGWTFRSDKLATEFREWLDMVGEYDELSPGEFKASGTEIATVMVVIHN